MRNVAALAVFNTI